MRINNNLMAMNTHRQLGIANNASAKSMEKLSSGYRINRAGDDAAGLSISEKMRGQIRGLVQASRNAQDGISLIQTAEGALSETHAILQRMRELAVQSANDTNVEIDRDAIQNEFQQLRSEIDRIGNTTEFNTQKLLDGGGFVSELKDVGVTTAGAEEGKVSSVSTLTTGVAQAQAKYTINIDTGSIDADEGGIFKLDLNGDGEYEVELKEGVDFEGSDDAATALGNLKSALEGIAEVNDNWTIDVVGTTGLTFTAKAGEAYDGAAGNALQATGGAVTSQTRNIDGADEVRGKYSFDIETAFANTGDTFTIQFDSDNDLKFTVGTTTGFDSDASKEDQASAIASEINNDGTWNAKYSAVAIGSKLIIEELEGQGGTGAVSVSEQDANATAGVYTLGVAESVEVGGKYTIDGVDILVTDDQNHEGIANGTAVLVGADRNEQAANLRAAINLNESLRGNYTATVANNTVTLTQVVGKESSKAPIVETANSGGEFNASFQIGANQGQTMEISIGDMRADALGIVEVDLSSKENASEAITTIESAISQVSAQRSELGAYQNRLEHTIKNLDTSAENLQASEARIRDVDMAKEMMEQTKQNILQQASTAMLAQANMAPQTVLQLLR